MILQFIKNALYKRETSENKYIKLLAKGVFEIISMLTLSSISSYQILGEHISSNKSTYFQKLFLFQSHMFLLRLTLENAKVRNADSTLNQNSMTFDFPNLTMTSLLLPYC